MKRLTQLFVAAFAAASLMTSSAIAAQCCDATAAKVKSGAACEKCADHACCKDAARKASKEIAKSGSKVAECKTCAAKSGKSDKKSS